MELSDEAINIISCACYPAHMQAAEDFIAKLEADRDEYRNLYHMGEAKIMSREAIIEQLSESELAKDVTRLEAESEALREYALGLMANSYHGMGIEERKLILESELIALLTGERDD